MGSSSAISRILLGPIETLKSLINSLVGYKLTIYGRRRRQRELGGLSQMKSIRNPNRKPTHPGAVLREDVLPQLAWTQGEFATRLMVSRQTVSDLLHEKKAVTAEMAIRIARAVGGTPESWLRMQEALDLWTAEIKFKNNPSIAPKALSA
jgi:addiction module HigA family antidote